MSGINPKDLIGAKKPNVALVPATAIVGMSEAMMNGAAKYGPYNWRDPSKKVQMMTYLSATLRHIYAIIDGEDRASDSNCHHLAHAMSSLAVLYDAIMCENVVDDRPVAGKAGKLIDDYFTSHK